MGLCYLLELQRGKEEMELCQMDQGCEGFLSEMTWIHFGVKAMFITQRGAFGEFNPIIRPLTCCLAREGLREKPFNLVLTQREPLFFLKKILCRDLKASILPI